MRRPRSPCGWRRTASWWTARAADTDTIVASARAYVHALNKLLAKRERTKPPEFQAALTA